MVARTGSIDSKFFSLSIFFWLLAFER
jgi:hypothetical protein